MLIKNTYSLYCTVQFSLLASALHEYAARLPAFERVPGLALAAGSGEVEIDQESAQTQEGERHPRGVIALVRVSCVVIVTIMPFRMWRGHGDGLYTISPQVV